MPAAKLWVLHVKKCIFTQLNIRNISFYWLLNITGGHYSRFMLQNCETAALTKQGCIYRKMASVLLIMEVVVQNLIFAVSSNQR